MQLVGAIRRIRNAQDDQFEVEVNIQLKATLFQLGTNILKKVHHFKSDSSSCYAKFIYFSYILGAPFRPVAPFQEKKDL